MKIFVHGVPDTSKLWTPLLEELQLSSKDFRTLSLPGFGCSRPEDFASTMDCYGNWLLEQIQIISHENKTPLDLVGHDWGAILSTRAASLRPDLVRSLAIGGATIDASYRGHLFAWLWATPIFGHIVMTAFTLSQLQKTLEKQGMQKSLAAIEASALDKEMKSSILSLYRSAMGLRSLGKWEENLSNLPEKLMLIWGENDPYVSLSFAEKFTETWGGKLHVEANMGHWAMATCAKSVGTILKKFWGENPG